MGNPHALACVRGVLVVSRGSDQDKILKLNKKAINFFFFARYIDLFGFKNSKNSKMELQVR